MSNFKQNRAYQENLSMFWDLMALSAQEGCVAKL